MLSKQNGISRMGLWGVAFATEAPSCRDEESKSSLNLRQ